DPHQKKATRGKAAARSCGTQDPKRLRHAARTQIPTELTTRVGLVPKTDEGPGDVGTCMARGFTARPGLLRSFYVPQDDAHRVTQRAMRLRAEHGGRATATIVSQHPRERDLLADVDEVLGADPVPTAEVAALLKRLAPHWAPYRGLTGKALCAQLAALGVKVRHRQPLPGGPGHRP
ncbi:MAG: hypothetical protein LC799_29595, partial [Actinobacteria bacterium]|nr:hypothetical protein [Actinomycetota bacterium]